jgi:hypothetical protein
VSADYLANYQFIEDDAKSIEVDQLIMRLFHEYFWCQVAWSSAGVARVVRAEESRDAEVCKIQISIFIEHKILWFDISMDNVLGVDVVQGRNDAGTKKFSSGITY